jgi:opacity protein-like surface antigen
LTTHTIQKLVLIALLTLSASVFAAPLLDDNKWNSYYLGGSFGYADGRANNNEIDMYNNEDVGKYSANGAQYGIYGGKNWSMNEKIVFGVDLGFGNLNIKNSRQTDFYKNRGAAGDSVATTSNGLFVEAAGRLGIKLIEEKALIYLKAGYIQTDIKQKFEDTCIGDPCGGGLIFSNGERQHGPLIGAGVEYSIQKNINIRLDYTHYDFGSVTQTSEIATSPGNNVSFTHNLKMDTLRIGAAYNF